MPEVVSVTFKKDGPSYYFDPGTVDCEMGDWVIVETARGTAMGRVVALPAPVSDKDIEGELKTVQRKAEDEEIQNSEGFRAQEEEALVKCADLISKHRLPMKLVSAEYNFDGSHLTVFFSAEGKVDFRALLKEMGSTFKTRVELRQIGARDVAKLLGGIGKCGRVLCCTTFLNRFVPISVRMARDQSLPLNPTTISGDCGKLLCCLKYEHNQYVEMKAEHPSPGKRVNTPQGKGTVRGVSHLKERVTVYLENDTIVEFDISEVSQVEQEKGRGNARK